MFDVVVLKSPDVLAQFGGVSVLVVVKCCDVIKSKMQEAIKQRRLINSYR